MSITPFLAEELYQKLTGGESVHLLDWPVTGHIDELVVEAMSFVQKVVNDGLSQRAKAGIKVRQPLPSIAVGGSPEALNERKADFEWMILVAVKMLGLM